MIKRLECEISGRVQLVMYRDFARRRAKALRIVGTVENFKNGNVFVVAEGEEDALGIFLEYLKKGPVFSQVTYVDSKWLPFVGEFNNFDIIWYERR